MAGAHRYNVTIRWTGNRGTGTSGYREYDRDHVIEAPGKAPIAGSSDPDFRGDPTRWTPEELLVASLSACHKLWYLHFCSVSGIRVTGYCDEAEGEMEVDADGGGRFTRVTLRPEIEIGPGDDEALATRLHHDAHSKCFIANSVNFPVRVEPRFTRAG